MNAPISLDAELLERHLIAASDALCAALPLVARLGVKGGPAGLYAALAHLSRVTERAGPLLAPAPVDQDDADIPY